MNPRDGYGYGALDPPPALPDHGAMLETNRHAGLLAHLADAATMLALLANDARSGTYDEALLKLVQLRRDVRDAIKVAQATKGA